MPLIDEEQKTSLLTDVLNDEEDRVIENYQQLLANVMNQYVTLHKDYKRMQDYYQSQVADL